MEADAKAAKLDDEARRALRQQRSVPILEELFAWLEGVRGQVLPKSPMGEAIGYALNQQGGAAALHGAGLPGDRQQRVGAWGEDDRHRSQELAVFRERSGRATAAVLFSLTETCKGLGVEPWAYLGTCWIG